MATSPASTDDITGWLLQNAIPLRHLEAGNGFDDLQPLKELWRNARVIGLGESTHGTREFFQVKHRLLEFLVSEMGYTVFALEASHTACEPVNDYIHGAQGDVNSLLSGIHYLAWHTEEFVAMVEWLRGWNTNARQDRKVTFLGADITYNERGREAVLDYLRRVAPDKVPDAGAIFEVLAAGEAKWPLRIDEAGMAAVQKVLPGLDNLTAWLDSNRTELVNRSSDVEFDRVRFYLRLMPQHWVAGGTGRTRFIAENLITLLERDFPEARAVFWAHNGHVDAGTYPGGERKAGHLLREQFGATYYACALEFGEGSFQYRIIEPGGILGDLTLASVGPPLDGTIPWHLARTGEGLMLVNLRTPSNHPAAREWLAAPQTIHGIGWAYGDPPSGDYEDVTPGASFDGVLFVERSTPVRPTATALEHAARKERF